MPRRIFLDMDGVLVDWVGGALRLLNRPSPYTHGQNVGRELLASLGEDPAQFWSCCGREFWRELEPTAECCEIVRLCLDMVGIENLAILSHPQELPGCASGKRDWIQKHLPTLSPHVILTEAKHFCAYPNTLLVDDSDKMINRFREAGGYGLLIPRPWNSLHGHTVLPALARCLTDWRLDNFR